jgi:YggT family protein
MVSILNLIDLILSIYMWIVIAVVIMSWLVAFNIVNRHNDIVRQISNVLYRLTEPVLGPIRRVLPNMGGLDLSPIVVFIAIWFIRSLLWEYGPRILGLA